MLPDAPTTGFPYRILALVGEGGMGQVYRAEDVELGRLVAIKVLKRSYLDALGQDGAQDAMRRFIQEARAAAMLSHPGITVVHRVSAVGAWPYIAMEWLDGQTLDDVLMRSGRVAVEYAARVGLALLSALDAAHRAGVVHRDIKPANVFITADRRVKVTDFGVARVQGSTLAQTQVGAVVGTPQYAAPEQLAGQAVDARADLYSVGVLLYELVTGKVPYDAENLYELIAMVQRGRRPRASSLAANVPPAFDRIIATALATSPFDRYSSAAEMMAALQPLLTAGAAQPAPRARAETPAAPEVPTFCADAGDPLGMVAALVRAWPATPLGAQPSGSIIERLLDRPLHTAAFCGGVVVGGATLLLCDGVLFDAIDPRTGRSGDEVIDALPHQAEATLHPCPKELDPRVVPLLASLVAPGGARLAGLDASLVDVPQLSTRLAGEGFDGVLRATRDGRVGFVLFSRGKRVLDLFGPGWTRDPKVSRWEQWLAAEGASVSVEDRRASFPSASYRHRLRGVSLDVVRARADDTDKILNDARESAECLRLVPSASTEPRAGDSILRSLLDADPAASVARWLLVDAPLQFEQFRRTDRWRAMLSSLDAVETVRLHHALAARGELAAGFDVTTFDAAGRALHVIDRVTAGTPEAVAGFIDRVRAALRADHPGGAITGAVLVAPSFREEALDAYLRALRSSRGSSLRAAFDLLTHREGYLAVGRGGCHVLLVEERDGRRRPLVPER